MAVIHRNFMRVEVRPHKSVSSAGKGPRHGGAAAQAMVHNFKKLPKSLQKVARSAFSKFSAEKMKELQEAGYSVRFCKPEGDVVGAALIPRRKTIELYVNEGDPHAETYLIHEMVHLADRLKFKAENGTIATTVAGHADAFSSRHDDRLKELHLDYSKRSLSQTGQQFAKFIKSRPDTKGRTVTGGGRRYNWELTDDKLKLTEKDRLTKDIEVALPGIGYGTVASAIGGAALMIGLGAGSLAIGGLVAAPLLYFGAKRIMSGVRALKDERALDGFQSPGAKVGAGGKYTFDLNHKEPKDIEPTSVYATLSRRPEEYLAESMTEYLRSPESRASLKERDPKMFDYCAEWNLTP